MKDWVNAALEYSQLSQAELARKLANDYGWSDNRSIFNKILNGDRELKAEEMLDISNATGFPLPGVETARNEPGLRRVEVAGHVQAGHFAETWAWDEGERYSVFVPDLPEYRHMRLYAAETRGPSMNKRYAEKTVIVFNSVADSHEEPMPGKRYVVERRRIGGEMEHTVKLLHRDPDGYDWLMPESDDPRFQAPISVSEDSNDGDEVIILGRVLFAVTRE